MEAAKELLLREYHRYTSSNKLTYQPESHEGFREAMILHKVDHINILKLNGVLRGVQIPGKNVIGNYLIVFC